MQTRFRFLALAVIAIPALANAQAPVAKAFRDDATDKAKMLIAAAEEMPAANYSFKPTPAQMTFGATVVHLIRGNDFLCGAIGGTKAPARTGFSDSSSKEVLVAQLKQSFDFCGTALAKLDDSNLTEELPVFGRKMSRAAVMTLTTGDWADHYSQQAIYLRLNGKLPPSAKKP